MLARLYQRKFGIDERDLLDFDKLRRSPASVPRLLFTHAGYAMRPPENVHLDILMDLSAYRGRKVVLLIRHPGDVAVSRYHHLKHRSSTKARRQLAEQPLEQFVWTRQGGIPSIVAFMNEFVRLPGVTVIHYRDLIDDGVSTLHDVAHGIGLNVGLEDILDAVEFGRLPNLKLLEQSGYFNSKRLRLARANDSQSGKVRNGTTGGYRVVLDPMTMAAIDAFIAERLDPDLGFAGAAGNGPSLT
jgi:hypothetical protein